MKFERLLFVAVFGLGVIANGCVTTETTRVEEYDSIVAIDGYLFTASDQFAVEAFNFQTGQWEELATGQSAATPSIPANTIEDNPDMFSYHADVQIATFDDAASFCRWGGACRIPPRDACLPPAKLRVVSGGQPLQTFGPPGPPSMSICMGRELQNRSFVQAAIACQSENSPELTVFRCASL